MIWGEEPTYPANGYRWHRLESLEETARSELIEQLRRQASELPDAAFIYRPRVVYGVARRT